MFCFSVLSFAQNKNAKASFEVDGVCMMCKSRIEKASLNTKGVKSAVWNVKSHELKLIFNEHKTGYGWTDETHKYLCVLVLWKIKELMVVNIEKIEWVLLGD